jgi:hypothetical protein
MSSLAKYLGRTDYHKGEIGLEIETESLQPYDYVKNLNNYWRYEPDGSLRNNGVEFIFRQPYTPRSKEYVAAMASFEDQAKVTAFIESVYTSVHVHLNMNDKTLTELVNFICLYWLFEEALTEYCGDYRNGNLFCLKTSNAEASYRNVQDLVRAVDAGAGGQFIARLDNNRFKYSGLNIVPLRNLGSVEVRTHPGCNDVRLIDRWVNILYMIYKKATTFGNPVEIINRLYGYKGKREFFELIFEEYAQYLNLDNLEAKMKNGIWYASSVAGIIDNWKDFGAKKPAKKNTEELKAYYVLDDYVTPAQPLTTGTGITVDQVRQYAAQYARPARRVTTADTATRTWTFGTTGTIGDT